MDESFTRLGLLRLAGLSAVGGTTTGSPAIDGDLSVVYVSQAGNDANDGRTWAGAKKQISSAVSSLGRSEGVIWVAPGSYAPFSLIGPNNRISVIGVGDVRVSPTSEDVGILIDNSAGTPLVGPLVENILVAGDGAGRSSVGMRLQNALRSTIRRCRIADCSVGLDLYNDASGFTERNSIENTLINNCETGIRYYRTRSGAASFSYNHFANVAVDSCSIGIDMGSVSPAIPGLFANSYVNGVVWGHSDGDVLVSIAADMLGCFLQLSLERLSGHVVGYEVHANAARTLEATIFTNFIGAFADKVRLAPGKELRWMEGRNTHIASGSTMNCEGYLKDGDTDPRLGIASDGGIAWGDGSGSFDVRLSRKAPNVIGLDAGDGLQFAEAANDLVAPAANEARLYTRDNGSGKTQLVVRFNTGHVVVIATQP